MNETVTAGRFVVDLVLRVPEAADLVTEHLDDVHDDRTTGGTRNLLLHLLMPEVLDLAVRCWHEGRRDVTARVLTVVDDALARGDDDVENAVLVSFVEHVGAFPEETPDFLATWPSGLQAARVSMAAGPG